MVFTLHFLTFCLPLIYTAHDQVVHPALYCPIPHSSVLSALYCPIPYYCTFMTYIWLYCTWQLIYTLHYIVLVRIPLYVLHYIGLCRKGQLMHILHYIAYTAFLYFLRYVGLYCPLHYVLHYIVSTCRTWQPLYILHYIDLYTFLCSLCCTKPPPSGSPA